MNEMYDAVLFKVKKNGCAVFLSFWVYGRESN